ncbi:permease-like cell division protein FtsX [Halotalea alkalilenta]|uniref:Cell division protein FtsX n=1 Tax=Halotalea alkalilenta TaxID=376489 RepID=A0A172YJ52_9GAMM|nr:permease-like cell division protein FtsX [Halotalea alkalilenta]ANF59243.1 cell division protein FtsX [Halotalea alkalilenta]
MKRTPKAATREPRPRKGARAQRISLDSRYQAWLRHHRQVAVDSGRRLVRQPFSSLFTMLAIAIALVLPAMLWLGLGSVRALDHSFDDSARMTLYLSPGSGSEQVMGLAERVRGEPGVSEVEVITAEQGLQEFQQALGVGDTLSLLDANPLPATLLVTPLERDPAEAERLAERLGTLEGVDEARLDLAWLERLRELGALGQRLTLGLAVLFGFGVLLVVGNTIRLAVENRRKEIEVVTLIGATRAFVRRPFLYSGAWFGLGGGVLAVLLLTLGRGWLSAPIGALARSYGSDYALPSLGGGGSLLMVACSILLSLIGAWVAVGRHLAEIRPR